MKRIVTISLILILTMTTLAFAASINGDFKGFSIVNLTLNGQAVATQVPAVNFFGKTSIPVADAAKAMNVLVEWDANTWTANLYKPSVNIIACASVDENAAGVTTITDPVVVVEKGFSYDLSVYATVSNLKEKAFTYRFILLNPTGETVMADLEQEMTFEDATEAKLGMFANTTFVNAAFATEGEYVVAFQLKRGNEFKTIGTTPIFAVAP